jgi:hypothetical protein
MKISDDFKLEAGRLLAQIVIVAGGLVFLVLGFVGATLFQYFANR